MIRCMRALAPVIAAFVALLSGCAHQPTLPTGPIPADLSQLERWQAHGRIAVSGPENGGSGSFNWQQQRDRSDIAIHGPIGIGSVNLKLHGNANDPKVELRTTKGEVFEGDMAWRELEARLGAPVPAGYLRYWMLGLPAPGEYQWLSQDPQGSATLEQSGWQIEYQQYSDDPGARVPKRIRAANGLARVRIVIDSWQLGR
ncbi:MAG TPA: lipoprotein insertase outer membrane protein LolB [Steroidobacteraceae bacterium]|nr:lipoprotein insertase outer membrane protein LolB [Steroidobacteraceae bacterium]